MPHRILHSMILLLAIIRYGTPVVITCTPSSPASPEIDTPRYDINKISCSHARLPAGTTRGVRLSVWSILTGESKPFRIKTVMRWILYFCSQNWVNFLHLESLQNPKVCLYSVICFDLESLNFPCCTVKRKYKIRKQHLFPFNVFNTGRGGIKRLYIFWIRAFFISTSKWILLFTGCANNLFDLVKVHTEYLSQIYTGSFHFQFSAATELCVQEHDSRKKNFVGRKIDPQSTSTGIFWWHNQIGRASILFVWHIVW